MMQPIRGKNNRTTPSPVIFISIYPEVHFLSKGLKVPHVIKTGRQTVRIRDRQFRPFTVWVTC